MIADILSILKFITDAQTRDTVKAIAQATSRNQDDWRKYVYVMKGQFRDSEWINIDAFTNELFRRVKDTGITETKFSRFRSVYTELIDNAHQYGGNATKKIVSINCIFSKWFIQIEIKDNGKGFNLGESLTKVRLDKMEGLREGKSGLELVSELCDKLEVKKSRVTAVIAGEDRIQVLTKTEKIGKAELLEITVVEDEQWSFLPPSWESFRDVIEKAIQPLVLIRFGRIQEKLVNQGSSVSSQRSFFCRK